MKVLICSPSLSLLGGVSNHYLGLRKYFKFNHRFLTIGSRRNISGLYFLLFDLFRLIFNLIFYKPDVVLLNPSFDNKSVLRDNLFSKLVYFFNIPYVVFFHGWNVSFEKEVNSKFLKYLFRAKFIYVLCSDFKHSLENLGYTGKVILTTTKVDDELLDLTYVDKSSNTFHFLFLSRLTKEKGVYIALQAFLEIQKKFPNVVLDIVGDGPEFLSLNSMISQQGIESVVLHGRCNGQILATHFRNSDAYLFPSSHGEGMPTSVLEAMAFGLPVITTPNAGIKDFFKVPDMGYYCDFNSVSSLVSQMVNLYSNQNISKVSFFNSRYAKNEFLASKVSSKIENDLKSVMI